MHIFRLAPMDRLIGGLTVVVLSVPFLLLGTALYSGDWRLWPVLALLGSVYGTVWFWWRPARFEVSETALELHFPMRHKRIPRAEVVSARPLNYAQFKEEFGLAVRVGAGGLWGGFGWLWTSRRSWVEFYISRTDGFLLIERRGAIPLLLTPTDPEEMARALRA